MLTLFNTLSRTKEIFKPIESGKIKMYVCGMTTYDYCHIGHARMLTAFDVIFRWLHASGYDVTYVRNITDIDDKIIRRAAENNESISELTTRFIKAMHEDMAELNILTPTFEPRATEHIAGMIQLIQKLIANGKAYLATNNDVYYSVREFANYGKLSGKTLDSLRSGERVEIDLAKKDPLDFVLWKSAKPAEPSWNSPWGKGRPGWHIECSVMSCHYLGEQFDIHGGGSDLQFPHHENEIAQSEAAHNHKYVNYWLHNGFINVDGEKMSKSLGNFFTIRDALRQYKAEVIRFFIVRSHYRSPINFNENILLDAKQSLTRLYTSLRNFNLPNKIENINWQDAYPKRFKELMDDDFNTPGAVAVLFEMANEVNKTQNIYLATQLKALANILGFLDKKPDDFLQKTSEINESYINDLINERNLARANKNWAESDRIRNELTELGIVLEDNAEKTSWRHS